MRQPLHLTSGTDTLHEIGILLTRMLESLILTLYGRIWINESPYSRKFYAVRI